MTDERGTTEVWTYTGRRVLADGKVGHVYLDPSGAEVAYSKVSATVIGGHYEVRVVREGDGVSVLGAKARYVGMPDEVDAVQRARWAAEDRAVVAADMMRKREAKDARESRDLGGMTLNEVAMLAYGLPAPQRNALMGQVMAKLTMTRAS